MTSFSDPESNLNKINSSRRDILTDSSNPFSDLNRHQSNLFNVADKDIIKDDDYQAKFNSDFRRHKVFLISLACVLSLGIIVTLIMTQIYYNGEKGCQENPSMGRPHFTCSDGTIPVWMKPDGTKVNFNNIFY